MKVLKKEISILQKRKNEHLLIIGTIIGLICINYRCIQTITAKSNVPSNQEHLKVKCNLKTRVHFYEVTTNIFSIYLMFIFSSGEAAFKTLNTSFGWAKNPMIHRLPDLEKDIPVTLVYGSKSWVDNATGYHIKYLRNESYVEVAVSYFVIHLHHL